MSKDTNKIEISEYYTNAQAYNSALGALLKAKHKAPVAIEQMLRHLANSLGFDLLKQQTGEVKDEEE